MITVQKNYTTSYFKSLWQDPEHYNSVQFNTIYIWSKQNHRTSSYERQTPSIHITVIHIGTEDNRNKCHSMNSLVVGL
jgi:hypothetical protein